MAALLLLATTISVFSLVCSKPYTVTEEVWFDVEIKDLDGPGEDYRGRLVIALFGETCPMTAMNFAAISKGFKTRDNYLTYKDTKIHRVVPDFVIQGGDTTLKDGTGGKSIYGDKFVDEGFKLSHKGTGVVSMANHGRDTNGSQFIITLSRARWLDGKHVVFGKVVRGMDVLKTIGEVPTNSMTQIPKRAVTIIDSGVVGLEKKYDLTVDQIASSEDIF